MAQPHDPTRPDAMMARAYTGKTINLQPTSRGYADMVRMFADNLSGIAPAKQRPAARAQVAAVIDITRYLMGQPDGPREVLRLLAEFKD